MSIAHELRSSARPLLLGWSVWLLVTWGLNLAIEDGSALPAVRWTLQAALVGVMAAWPAWRLSERPPTRPLVMTLVDLAGIVLIFQALALRIHIEWPLGSAALIDAVFIVSATAAAACIHLGRRCGPIGRTAALGVSLACWLVSSLLISGAAPAWALALAPVRAMWRLSDPMPIELQDAAAMSVSLGAAVVGLIVVWTAAYRLCAVGRTPPSHAHSQS